MPAPTVPGPLDGADFRGKVSTPPTNRSEPTDCRHCGSQLGGPYVGVRFMGRRAVRVWACPCGHERRLEVEAAAA